MWKEISVIGVFRKWSPFCGDCLLKCKAALYDDSRTRYNCVYSLEMWSIWPKTCIISLPRTYLGSTSLCCEAAHLYAVMYVKWESHLIRYTGQYGFVLSGALCIHTAVCSGLANRTDFVSCGGRGRANKQNNAEWVSTYSSFLSAWLIV